MTHQAAFEQDHGSVEEYANGGDEENAGEGVFRLDKLGVLDDLAAETIVAPHVFSADALRNLRYNNIADTATFIFIDDYDMDGCLECTESEKNEIGRAHV